MNTCQIPQESVGLTGRGNHNPRRKTKNKNDEKYKTNVTDVTLASYRFIEINGVK